MLNKLLRMKPWPTVILILFSASVFSQPALKQGRWRVLLSLNDSTPLPFTMDVHEKTIDLVNAGEHIAVDEINYSGDSVIIKMPVFDSEIRATFADDTLSGIFINHARLDKNIIPVTARHDSARFSEKITAPGFNMSGRWEVIFAGDDPPLNISIGEFRQQNNFLTGTFLTPTGDYRYLEGFVSGNQFRLSCFDGSHLFLFTGVSDKNGTISGHYYSGKHWHDTWTAKRNEHAALPNPDSLTFLKPGYKQMDFSFPDADSNIVSLHDNKFESKLVIVQIMGTWCPNCMDETAFLSPFYKQYKEKGVEIIALDFEKRTDFQIVKQNLLRLKKRYAIDYTLLYAGTSDQKLRGKALPMLNNILSFPTTIFLDKNKHVLRIHTGFSGPATGEHYEKWKNDFYNLVDSVFKK
ncbi:MAG: TlpA disulfide reductase family protein [Bacteroidetes bacterium]|nr:TlpA disulfide reductase family protein [Bacteroidota bacterium]